MRADRRRAPWHPGRDDHRGRAYSAGGTGPPRGRGGPGPPGDPGRPGRPGDLARPRRRPGARGDHRRLEQAMGSLGTAAMTSMEQRLPWFRGMSAENRSWIGLVAQAGIAAFVDWVRHPERSRQRGGRRGVRHRAARAGPGGQPAAGGGDGAGHDRRGGGPGRRARGARRRGRAARGVLRYTREVAFAAAQVYARTAEARGAWDARLEALVVNSLVRGEVDEGVHSWASALNWSSATRRGDRGHAGQGRRRAGGAHRRAAG